MALEEQNLTLTPKSLVGYCGLYCGACKIYQGKFKQAVENLRNLIKFYGFDKITADLAKWNTAFGHYSEFEEVMKAFEEMFGSCPACVGGGGDPSCQIRVCCQQKRYDTCAECKEMQTCQKLEPYAKNRKELERIKALGIGKWVEEMQKQVDTR